MLWRLEDGMGLCEIIGTPTGPVGLIVKHANVKHANGQNKTSLLPQADFFFYFFLQDKMSPDHADWWYKQSIAYISIGLY